MPIVVVTPPTVFPVSRADAKKHLHAEEFADDDVYIDGLIAAATGHMDGPAGSLGRAIMPQVLEWRGDSFGFCDIRLAFPPVVNIVSVKYDDEDGAEQIVPGTDYRLVGQPGMPRVALTYGASWPQVMSQSEAVRVRYNAGYPDAASVPAPIKQAILLLVGHWYANREAVVVGSTVAELPLAVRGLLFPFQSLA
ncbi:phage gp6-like head-tail connector protein [Tardiphaga alba]|uniref:Phage gp6-like head-tail connector protein n=1 Tax=Tardiphaga alba TaxID=340268 RepID=A0ABX8AFK1_9BRAD|nr:head-tail connector protein [Tardiphaga alba]QUS40580.1 phage gp6-like head-tail connector protein [Tardiphaga alba]